MVVLSFKFDQNRLSGTEILGVKVWVPALLWPVAYTALYYHTGVMTNDHTREFDKVSYNELRLHHVSRTGKGTA